MKELKYKLIVSDFDDTLVNTPAKVDEYTLEVLREYIKRGGFFTIATGRMSKGITANLGEIPLNAPLITYQGAKILDFKTFETLNHFPIERQYATKLLEKLQRENLAVNVYCDDILYIARVYPFTDLYCKINNIGYEVYPDLAALPRDFNKECSKILCTLTPDDAKKLEKEYLRLFGENLSVTRSSATYLEFTDLKATKGKSVKRVADMLNIPREAVMCFGDSTNDVSMLEYAGRGVAVGNAMEELKDIAREVCPPCKEQGVAKTIEKYCL